MGTSLAVQWLRIHLPMQGIQVRRLIPHTMGHLSLPAATADLTTTEPGHSRACVPKREKLTQHKEDLARPKANK